MKRWAAVTIIGWDTANRVTLQAWGPGKQSVRAHVIDDSLPSAMIALKRVLEVQARLHPGVATLALYTHRPHGLSIEVDIP